MIGGRILDDTVLVGFALGRSVYVLAAGKLACPGCAAPLRDAAGYVPPRRVQPLALTPFRTKPGDTPLTEVNRSQISVCDSSKLPASARLANIHICR